MKNLKGMFWTNTNEMVEEIEELGYEVLDVNDENITIGYEDEDGEEMEETLELIIAGRTITIA